ncbi:MAG: single-stranded-DNA-specific exonuclease RecJ [Cyanobacteria bacterium P01_F01_bin.53]
MPQYPIAQDSSDRQSTWQIVPADELTADWIKTVAEISGLSHPTRGAQLLWSRQLRSADLLKGFLHAAEYSPASPFAFGEEMVWAVDRLVEARDRHETVAIWGDFDADGVTSTAVLWDGLRQFFQGENQLSYFIPNRLKESHGLSISGVDQLAAQGVNLIVTCDTGSTNPLEIEHARELGMDVIVTDHHTLPVERPDVVAIVNPRALTREHPMADLSGVAVAYKLIEALYEKLPAVPARPLSELVDLVAIGLIADLVELRGDCRYLAQIGIGQLQTHLKTDQPVRPGVARLLQLCRRAGDRPTDISFGLGPRINAVSRIYGDASFCVELLTSRDPDRCRVLAEKAELANARRKALQNDVFQQVTRQLETRDLSTMGVIVLCDPQWPVGVLGLVAGQVAQQYGKPTILLTVDAAEDNPLVRGSARSVNQIDLYGLVNSQAQLLQGFGGHPFAAGLSLHLADLPMFTAAINQQYRQQMGGRLSQPSLKVDLVVTVAELGRDLFQELKLLEPCGMGNPVPKLLIKNAWFEDVWHQKLKDRTGGKVGYIKANFKLCDHSRPRREEGFPGLWWGHYKDDLPPGRWDVVAELDYNSHPKSRQYEIRLIDIRPAANSAVDLSDEALDGEKGLSPLVADWLLDCRTVMPETIPSEGNPEEVPGESAGKIADKTDLVMGQCPTQWKELLLWRYQADRANKPLTLAYAPPVEPNPIDKWKTLLGVAKFVSRQRVAVTRERLGEVLGVCDRTLTLGLEAIAQAGFTVTASAIDIRLQYDEDKPLTDDLARTEALSHFLAAIQEEHFRRQYFYQAPVSTLQAVMNTDVDGY